MRRISPLASMVLAGCAATPLQLITNANLETGARNDLKNKAAALGGNLVVLLTQRTGGSGGTGGSGQQTNVTLSGNVYRCPE